MVDEAQQDPWEIDAATRRARAATEPPVPQPDDITNLDELMQHVGRAVKYTGGEGASWRLGVVQSPQRFISGEYGCNLASEVGRRGVHGMDTVTATTFAAGLVVRLATQEDCAGIKFSYGYTPAW